MKSLIVLIAGLLVVGCETPLPQRPKSNSVKQLTLEEKKALRDSVAGTYEVTIDGDTGNLVLLANGKVKFYDGNGEKDKEGTWKLVEKEVHIKEVDIEAVTDILKIELNGNLTIIALIEDGKRTDIPKDEQFTFKIMK